MTTTKTRPVTRDEYSRAAEARAAGADTANYLTQLGHRQRGGGQTFSPPEGRARVVDFPATLRAKKSEYNGQDMYHLRGIASVCDTAYTMYDMFGPYEEIIDSRAFDKTLSADPDVTFLENHKGLSMARTIPMPGKHATLILGMDDVPGMDVRGLGSDAYVNPRRTDVSNLVIAIDDGNITEMSFAFMLTEAWWSDDFMTFKITEVDIDRGDVSAVNYGANPYTSIAARQREILAEVRQLPPGAARAALAELMGRADVDVDVLYRAYAAGRDLDRAEAAPPAVVPAAASVAGATLRLADGTPTGVARGRSVTHVTALLAEDE